MAERSLTSPEYGGRLLARLRAEESSQGSAAYALVVAEAGATWEADAAVHEGDGRVEFGAWSRSEPPPVWLVQAARALLRGAWQRRRAGHPWPRRLARWRPAPGAEES